MASDLFFKHDIYAAQDSKLKELKFTHPATGYAVFFDTLELMYRNEGEPILDRILVDDVSHELGLGTGETAEILDELVSCDLLKKENNKVYSDRVQESIRVHREYLEQQREYGRRGGQAKAKGLCKGSLKGSLEGGNGVANRVALAIQESKKERKQESKIVRNQEINLSKESDTSVSTKNDTRSTTKFVKPSIEEIKAYCQEQGYNNFDVAYFFDHYEGNGWKVGNASMKDWKATVRNWVRRDLNSNQGQQPKKDGLHDQCRTSEDFRNAGYKEFDTF